MGGFSRQFYLKLAGGCFVIGACMELFMIKTGFYGVVTDNEAGRWLEHAEEKKRQAALLRAALLERQRKGEVRLPAGLLKELEAAEAKERGSEVQQQQQQQRAQVR